MKAIGTDTPRFLGVAFLLQAIASAVGGLLYIKPMIAPGDVRQTMLNVAGNTAQWQTGIFFQMITAMGVIMLGCMLYQMLKRQNRNIALAAMGLYIVEAAIFAASRIPALALVGVSRELGQSADAASLEMIAKVLIDAADTGDWLHMLIFGLGATMFYILIFNSRLLPRPLAIVGLVAAPVALIGTALVLLGVDLPLLVFLPNLPFELAAGFWLVAKGAGDIRPDATPK